MFKHVYAVYALSSLLMEKEPGGRPLSRMRCGGARSAARGRTRQVGTARTGAAVVGPVTTPVLATPGGGRRGSAGGVVAWRVHGQYQVQEIIVALHRRHMGGNNNQRQKHA